MIHESAKISLLIQFITGIINFDALSIDVPQDKQIFKDLLNVELGVQTVEFIYYFWMVNNLSYNQNITPTRYLDWIITTPTMLITLMAYLDSDNTKNLRSFIKLNKKVIVEVTVLNFIMLLFGLLSEFKILNTKTAVALGFIPFALYFKIIYNKFITKNTTKRQTQIYGLFLIIWSLYGVAALLPYNEKNTMYNILDLFAKNFFGILLVYIVWTNRIK
jgi:bacteriorhodopsin